MAARRGLVALIERPLPPSRRPLSMGPTLVLAAINRAVWPCAKRAWAAWAHRPSLQRLYALRPEARTRQYCWAPMDTVAGVAFAALEAALPRTVVHEVGRTLETRCDDPAPVFPSLASGTARSERAHRGHSTHQRCALRQCRVALRGSRDGPSPLSADGYDGHTGEATRCPVARTALRQRVERLGGP